MSTLVPMLVMYIGLVPVRVMYNGLVLDRLTWMKMCVKNWLVSGLSKE